MKTVYLPRGHGPQHYRKKTGISKIKITLSLLTVILLFSVTVTGSNCSLKAETSTLTNPFYKGAANIGVVEQNNGDVTDGIKDITLVDQTADKNVWIKNLNVPGHNVSVYVRVRLIAVWRNADGKGSGIPVNVTYTMAQDDPNTVGKWAKTGAGQDAVYYFTKPVDPGCSTDQLLDGVMVNGSIPTDKKLEIEVLADAVQSDGEAAKNTWGVNPESLQS